MVSLIFVSHSYELAKATVEYIKKVTNVNVPMLFSGGVGENNEELGTDAVDIFNTIEKAYSDDGVLIFCDLGSALISSELAISMLDEKKSKNVKITSAPFLEGGINAAIQSSLNKELEKVIYESIESLTPKISYVKDKEINNDNNDFVNGINLKSYMKAEYKVLLENGFHARPVFMFINMISTSKSIVYVANKTKNKPPVMADSITKITLLNIEYGDVMEVYAKGVDAEAIFTRLEHLLSGKLETIKKINNCHKIKNNFTVVSDGKITGTASYIYFGISVKDEIINNSVEEEGEKFINAITKVKEDLLEQKTVIEEKNLSNNEYLIFETYISMLFDEYVLKEVYALIEQKYSAAFAYNKVMKEIFKSFESLDDGYIKERKYDIEDILNQVLKRLLNIHFDMPEEENTILIVDTIYASIVSEMPQNIKAVISINGSPISHAAILLKALNIPYIIYKDAMKLNGKQITIDTKNTKEDIIKINN